MYEDKNSILDCMFTQMENTPDKIALVAMDRSVNYKTLLQMITAVASLLKNKGVKKGDRILLEASHTVEYIVCSFGIQLAGGVHVTLEHNAPRARAEEIASELNTFMMLTGPNPLEVLGINLDRLLNYPCEEFPMPDPDMLQEIMFTTGTTGKSKGVMITHGTALCRCIGHAQGISLKDDSVWLIPSPMNHAAGLRRTQMALSHGNTVCLVDGFVDLKLFFERMKEYSVNMLYLPPAGVHHLLLLARKKLAEFNGQLDCIISSSSVLSGADKEKLNKLLPDVRKFDVYGSSETGSVCCFDYSQGSGEAGCVGKPFPVYKVFTVNDDMKPFEATRNNPGIVTMGGKGLATGYWNEPELTVKTFCDGVVYMSDMGYLKDGLLYLVGRRDSVINIGGLKVAPLEVEEVAARFPSIDQCVCVPCKDLVRGTLIKMYVVVREGFELNKDELISFMENHLESYKLPAIIEHIDALPRTYNGKIDRKQLLK